MADRVKLMDIKTDNDFIDTDDKSMATKKERALNSFDIFCNETFGVTEGAKKVTFEHIMTYCDTHNELEWLLAELNKTYTDKNGKENKPTLLQLRKVFFDKFFADKKVPAEKELSMLDKLNALLASKNK